MAEVKLTIKTGIENEEDKQAEVQLAEILLAEVQLTVKVLLAEV